MEHELGRNEAQNANDKRVQNLTGDKADKGVIDVTADANHLICPAFIKHRIGNLLPLSAESILCI